MGKNHNILFIKRIRKDTRQKICGREKREKIRRK